MAVYINNIDPTSTNKQSDEMIAESENSSTGVNNGWIPETTEPSELPENLLSNMIIPQNGYLVNHIAPTENIIIRNVPNPIFDQSDVLDMGSDIIYELLPKPIVYPSAPPINLEVYVANWSRIHNYGGITDKTKDPTITSLNQWTIENWAKVHKWPEVATLDPTYVFFTDDPALFYTQRTISHYEPDDDGKMKPVMVSDDNIIWKLNGKEVHRGWYMDLSALSRTVEVHSDQAVIVPKLLTIEAKNTAGIKSKQIKFAAIDSDDGALIGGDSEIDNFTSTFQGQFVAVEDASNENHRSAVFWPDPRYGPRDIYVRFKFGGFGDGKSKRRKFRKAKATFKIDNQRVDYISGTEIYDRWKFRIGNFGDKNHQDAMPSFPEMFNENGRIKQALRNQGGGDLSSFGVTDWTEGRASALFCDEEDFGSSKLYKFQKKPGPFTLEMYIDFKVRLKGQGKKSRFWQSTLDYTEQQLNLDTPLQPIDLGVVVISYDHKDLGT